MKIEFNKKLFDDLIDVSCTHEYIGENGDEMLFFHTLPATAANRWQILQRNKLTNASSAVGILTGHTSAILSYGSEMKKEGNLVTHYRAYQKPEAKKTKINRVYIGKDRDKIYVLRSEACNQPDHNKSISAMVNELMKMEFVSYVSQLNPVRANKDGSFSVHRYTHDGYELNQTQLKKLIGHNTFEPGITLIADPVQVDLIKSNIIFK
jgi:hypothetical protein